MEFNELGLIEPILKSINYEKPTEIQEKAIPLILQGKDVIAQSATGSGKTFAFASGIIQNIEKGNGVQALILTPTRELALQIVKDMMSFSKYKHLNIASVYGGVSLNPQIQAIKTADVVIGTPGRMLDHLERRTINLSRVKILVLDEADRMLDMGFIDDVDRIVRQCSEKRQTLLFSATISQDIMRLASKYLKQPVRVNAEDNVDPGLLKQVYYDVQDNMKFSLLVHLLKKETSNAVMVFCNTQRITDFVAKNLRKNGIDAESIHGGMSQAQRIDTLRRFHNKEITVLVCTDVASRGLDIKEVTHVYNYDIPNDSKAYTHRIGRTARAGKSGMAVNILSNRDHDNFSAVLRFTDHKIEKGVAGSFERVFVAVHDNNRRFQGRNMHRRRRY